MNDQDFMEKALKEYKIEVVVSAVGGGSILDQLTLVKAIKTAGATVKACRSCAHINALDH